MLISNETATLNALDQVVREMTHELSKNHDAELAATMRQDLVDVRRIRAALYEGGDSFEEILDYVMELDTIVREQVLEAFKREGLQQAAEETGKVFFIG